MDNEVLRNIRSRRSCRNFKKEQITHEELLTVLEAGTWAPTARGLQDPWIVAVQDESLKKRIESLNAQIMGSKSNPFYDAPTLVLVFGSPTSKNYLQDGSLVLGTMMLAAHSIGLGSCWINREIEMFSTPEGKSLKKVLGIPEEAGGIGALALGYPEGPGREPKPRKKDYFRII